VLHTTNIEIWWI